MGWRSRFDSPQVQSQRGRKRPAPRSLAKMTDVEGKGPAPERQIGHDGVAYSYEEFTLFYGAKNGTRLWNYSKAKGLMRLRKRREIIEATKTKLTPEYNIMKERAMDNASISAPRTPDPVDPNITKREWEKQVSSWKRDLEIFLYVRM